MVVIAAAIGAVVGLVVAMLVWVGRDDATLRVEGPRPDGEIPGSLFDIRNQMAGIARRQDRKFARNLTVMGIGVVLALVAVGVAHESSRAAARANSRARRAESALAAYKAVTLEARVGSCEQSNVHEMAQAQAEKAEERARQTESGVIVDRFLTLLHITPTDLHDLQVAHLKAYDATVDRAHPPRDCTPAGIAAYLRGVSSTATTSSTTTVPAIAKP